MGQTQKISGRATTHRVRDGVLEVRYHETDVVVYDMSRNVITFDTGGWRTQTTRTRMLQASNQFDISAHVYQEDHEWFVALPEHDKVIPWPEGQDEDRITIDLNTGEVLADPVLPA